MGGWIGGQAEYVMVPYADFNLLKVRLAVAIGEERRLWLHAWNVLT
jgi:threonine dehydrogenase-like Zn-dependent dehydrogenase